MKIWSHLPETEEIDIISISENVDPQKFLIVSNDLCRFIVGHVFLYEYYNY